MELIPLSPAFTDERGTITDLLNDVCIKHVALITSRAGTVRGNHYHKKASQYNYVLSGRMELVTRAPGGGIVRTVQGEGSLCYSPPLDEHAVRFLEDTLLLELTTEPRDKGRYEEDTVRLEVPLIPQEHAREQQGKE